MIKVEIRPGIWIRLTEEDAAQRGLLENAEPLHKASTPQASKPKRKPKAKTAPVVDEPAADIEPVVESEPDSD